ncbi:unnamed protein product [Rotaria socialis]|nr:unnamed protein product [Rotaria socialis]
MRKPRTSLDHEWKLISYFEDLSNELFYEIFDYLDGLDLFEAFLNLNVRFQCLLSSILIRLNPSFSSCMQSNYESRLINVVSSTRQRILAIFSYEKWMTNSFYALLTIDSSFHRLESLFLVGLNSYRLISLLTSLTTLYNLSSLTIVIDEDILDLTETYRMLCGLPTLKYFKLSFESEETYSSLAIVTNDHFSNLKYLIMNHSCTFIGLTSILSCTPQLCYLNCMMLNEPSDSIKECVKIALSNLTSIKIGKCYLSFDKFEIFIQNVCAELKVLHINTYSDTAYLNGSRWEQSIQQNMPHLCKFEFQYHEIVEDTFEFTPHHALMDQFVSSFWIKKQWTIEILIDILDWSGIEIIYSVHPYAKRWHELNELNGNHHFYYIEQQQQSVIVTISEHFHIDSEDFFFSNFHPVLTTFQVSHLVIESKTISIRTLIEFLHLLPNLDSLKLCSLSLLDLTNFSRTENETLHSISKNSKITKVNLEQTTQLADVELLIDLCPQLQYFEMKDFTAMDFKLFIQFVTMKIFKSIHHSCVLCFCMTEANDKAFELLQDIIPIETMACVYNKIYIKLK